MNDNPEQPQSAESSELPGDGQPASRPRRRSRRPAVRGEAAGVQSSGVESGVSAAREPHRERVIGESSADEFTAAPLSAEPGSAGFQASDAAGPGQDDRRGPKGPRNRMNRRRPGRNGQGPRGPGGPRTAENESPAGQGGASAAGPSDPDQVIPIYSRQAKVGVDATDPRRRNAPRGAPPREADDDAPKLHKLLADAGIGSRREMEELIIAGRVSVNGQPAYVGQRIGPSDQVRVNGRPLNRRAQKPAPKVLLYHKPPGEICSRDDPGQRATVFERLPRLKGERWVAVGRLDFNTEGLLVFTTSGELANLLMHPRFGWEREYAVRILGRIDDETREKLLAGIPLEDGPANFLSLEDVGGDGANHWYRVVIGEGRNREVRRIFEAVGLIVSRLVRIRFGPIGLPAGLIRSRWVELNAGDVTALTAMLKQVGRDAKAPPRRAGPSVAGQPDAPEPGRQRPESGMAEADDEDLDREPSDEQVAAAAARSGLSDQPLRADDADRLFDDEDEDDEFESQPPPDFALVPQPRASKVNREDDDWQPTSADAHLSGITGAVRKQGRQQRFGAGFGQGGLPGQPKPGGQGRRNRGAGQGGSGVVQGGGFGGGFGGGQGQAGNRGGQGAQRTAQGGNRGGQGGNRGGQGGQGGQGGNRGGQGTPGGQRSGSGRPPGGGRRRGPG
jgi:23S rRNA pseudouridine2605 synthase